MHLTDFESIALPFGYFPRLEKWDLNPHLACKVVRVGQKRERIMTDEMKPVKCYFPPFCQSRRRLCGVASRLIFVPEVRKCWVVIAIVAAMNIKKGR